jgi:hypothetical protein
MVCAVLYFVSRALLQIRPEHAAISARSDGQFTEGGGWYPGEPFVTARPVRAWGSWCGGDENTGTLTLGPFPAPERLRFGIGGYPARTALYVEHMASRARLRLNHADVGERWRIADFPVPVAWHGQPISLIAVDEARGPGGWLALTEPVLGGPGASGAARWTAFAAWTINGLLLGVLWLAAARELTRRDWVTAPWIPLAAAAVVAAAGYVVFWAYLFHPSFGRVATFATLLAGGVLLARRRQPGETPPAAPYEVARLALIVGGFYLALLHIFPTPLDFYELAANRFRNALPADNALPQVIAERLLHGESLKFPLGDWLSSDRPPLQSGWILLTAPVLAALGIAPATASGTSAMWFQFMWLAAAHGLFRTLGLSRRRTAAWIAVLSLSGFFLQNTLFTWPKLGAGALACGTFGLWVLTPTAQRGARETVLGAVLAALAWLAHGGVAFSFLILAPWIAWQCVRGRSRHWAPAALAFALLVAPWTAYQKFYDPPGNRLLKWHLGGQVAIDARGTWQTIRENYAASSRVGIWHNKRSNFQALKATEWSVLLPFTKMNIEDRRSAEFFHLGPMLTWWVFGVALLPGAWLALARRGDGDELKRRHLALLLWTSLTVPVWCLLLFAYYSTLVHHGSYAMVLSLFVLLSVAFEWAGPRWLVALVAALQGGMLAVTWVGANTIVNGAPDPGAMLLAVGTALALLGMVVAALRPEPPERAVDLPAPTLPAARG